MDIILNEYHRNISDEELLEDVKLVAERLSQNTLTKREYIAGGGRFSNNTFLRRFGSWRKTLRKFVEYMNENTISQKSESKTILSKKENEFYERQDKKI